MSAGDQGAGATLSALSGQINAIPLQVTSNVRAAGFALTGAYANCVTDSIIVPEGRTRANLLCIGVGTALDTTTGGATTSYGRILIDGAIGDAAPAAKDAGATFVNNVIHATFARSFDVTPGSSISVALQMYGVNGSAFPAQPANSAQLATIATFTP